MAKEKGFYNDVGLDVTINEYTNDISPIDTVLKTDNSYGVSYSNIIAEYLKGKPLVFVANFFKQSPLVIATKKDIHLPSDLKGKRVMGVGENINSAMFLVMFKKFGLTLDDFKRVEHTFHIDDFINNKVDAMTVYTTNETYFLDKLGIEYNLLNPTVYGAEFYDANLFTSQKEIEQNPERVNNFREASIKGWRYALENVDETIALIMKKYNTLNKPYEALQYEAKLTRDVILPSIHEIGSIDIARVKLMADNFLDLGLVSNKPKINLDDFIFKYNHKTLKLTSQEREYLQKKKKITICVNPDHMPFEAIQEGKYVGIGADIISILKNRFLLPIELKITNTFRQSVELTKENSCDMIPMIMDNKKDKDLIFSKTYLHTPIALITKKDVPFIVNLKQLKNKNIITVNGYSVSRIIKENYPNFNLIEVNSVEKAFELIREEKAFALAAKVVSINNIFYKNQIEDLKIASQLHETIDFTMGFNPNNTILPPLINRALDNISKDEKENIYFRWIYVFDEQNVNKAFIWKIATLVFFILCVLGYWLFVTIRLNKKYKIAKVKAEKTALVKSNFLSNISHEIRTPMNVILSMAHILNKTNLEKKQQEHISKIVKSSKVLLTLLNDILDFSKIEAGKLKIEKTNFSLDQLLQDIEDMFSAGMEEKELEFKIIYKNEMPHLLYGDGLRISQILTNLVSNALKFTEHGKIEIEVETLSSSKYRISVNDTGVGLTKEQLPSIFDSFTQADDSTTRKFGGTGLGLAISKNLVDLLGGKIYVYSSIGVGSSFIFEIPLEKFKSSQEIHNMSFKKEKVIIKNKEIIKLENISDVEIEQLFSKLTIAIKRKRPMEYQPLIETLLGTNLSKKDREIIIKMNKLLAKYNFKSASGILDER